MSVKRNLIKTLREADKENEWSKLKRESMGSNPENLNTSSPCLQLKMSTPDSTSGGGVRKSCGPLYRMYTKVPPHLPRRDRDTDVERDTPVWRFFVKNVSPTFIILTFVPWSYKDCKSLMLGAEPKAWNLLSPDSPEAAPSDNEHFSEQSESEKLLVEESTLNPEAKPFQPVSTSAENCPSPLSSRGWVLDNLDSLSNVFDPSQSITDLHNQSSWDLNKGNLDPTSPFRLRARSWEPMKPQSVVKMKKHISPRIRTHSVGSKCKNWTDQKLKRKLMYEESGSLLSLNTRAAKQVKGSIDVPVYVYRCCVDNLIDALVLKSEYTKDFKDLYWSKNVYGSSEEGFEADVNYEEPFTIEETSDDVDLIQGKS